MTIDVELQLATKAKTLPHPSQFREWVGICLWQKVDTAELTIRIVDEEESESLNERFRKKTGPTNVLSFQAETVPGVSSRALGDIVICAPIVEREANAQNKLLLAHWAHMVVHGTLHLLGYDHEQQEESIEMAKLETEILLQLGFEPPYRNEGDLIES